MIVLFWLFVIAIVWNYIYERMEKADEFLQYGSEGREAHELRERAAYDKWARDYYKEK